MGVPSALNSVGVQYRLWLALIPQLVGWAFNEATVALAVPWLTELQRLITG